MCGEIGIIGCRDALIRAWRGACMLERRGPQAVGIAVVDENGKFQLTKALGSVSEVFNELDLTSMSGSIAIAHIRYATAGPNNLASAPPHSVELMKMACCSNGDFPQVVLDEVWGRMRNSMIFRSSDNDSEMLVKYFAMLVQRGATLNEAMADVMKLEGAFSLVMIVGDKLIAARDPRGFHPLVLGVFKDGGCCVASEPCAFPPINARFVREIQAGEMVIISEDGEVTSEFPLGRTEPTAMCSFEGIYFAVSRAFGISVQEFRCQMGIEQAIEEINRGDNIQVDYVMPIPNSSNPVAQGFAEQIGSTCRFYMRKVRSKRHFLGETQEEREALTAMNFILDVEEIKGKSFFLVDDSIVRGTTTGLIIKMLREAGALEIHLRVASPMILYPCFYGIDMKTHDQLIASKLGRNPDRVKEWIGGLDSLHYLSLEGLKNVIRRKGGNPDQFCFACFDGKYKTRR